MKITFLENDEKITIDSIKIGTPFTGKEILSAEIAPEDKNDPQMMEYIETAILPRLPADSAVFGTV